MKGLQQMTSESNEVKALLSSLLKKVNGSSDDYTSQHIGMCFYGLQNMKNTKNVEKVLYFLNNRVERTTHSLEFNNIVNAIYGLKVNC